MEKSSITGEFIPYEATELEIYKIFDGLDEVGKETLLQNGEFLTLEQLAQLAPDQQELIFQRLSSLIHDFRENPKTKNEMLDQEPEKLMAAFRQGLSEVFVIEVDGERVPIAHCAMWRLANIPPTDQLQGCRVYELGSWFVAAGFRNHKNFDENKTYGELVAQRNIDHVYDADKEQGFLVAALATVKRTNSMRGLSKVGFKAESFHAHQFAAALTCTCPNSSEIYTDEICGYRRTHENGETHHFIGIDEIGFAVDNNYVLPNGNGIKKIPCTLMIHESDTLCEIEDILMQHYLSENEFLYDVGITPDMMKQLADYYSERFGIQY